MDKEHHVHKKKVRILVKEDWKREKEKGVSKREIWELKKEQDEEEQDNKESWIWFRVWRWRVKERKKGNQRSKRKLRNKDTAEYELYAYLCSSYASLVTFVHSRYNISLQIFNSL
jgi:hypothetical protein